MITKNRVRIIFLCLPLAFWLATPVPLAAMSLLEVYSLAKVHDPAFQAAKADRAVLEADVTVARLAYLPVANAAYGQDTFDNKPRTTVQIAQPVIDLERFALVRSSHPRSVLSETGFRLREQDLSERVFSVVSELIFSRETLRFNEEQIKALSEQERRSRRRFELGQGTITEASTAQVRHEQALARRKQLEALNVIAHKKFTALTGVSSPPVGFSYRKDPQTTEFEPLLVLIDKAYSGNAKIIRARTQERLAELDRQRIMAGYLPQINAVARTSSHDGNTTNYTGFQLSIPLGVSAANFATQYKAAIEIDRARELKRDTEETEKLELERLWSLTVAGIAELKIRKNAIAAAELSALGSTKSYEAGVTSAVDVVNAILIVFDTKQDYLKVVTQTAENFLRLRMIAADHPTEALSAVQEAFMGREVND